MLGCGFMARAHSEALIRLRSLFYSESVTPRLVAVTGRSIRPTRQFAETYGYSKSFIDWHKMLSDQEIDVLDNAGPNDVHKDPCIEGSRNGKHVFCEKPLARNSDEAQQMVDAAHSSGIKHMVAFNFRFAPAVRLAWKLVKEGNIGKPYSFRGHYLGDWMLDRRTPLSWRTSLDRSGSGSVLDQGSHLIDLLRYLIGEPEQVFSVTRTLIRRRPAEKGGTRSGKVETEDSFCAILGLERGATAMLEASRACAGHAQHLWFEINGSSGSMLFDTERLNELQVCTGTGRRGFQKVPVLGKDDPCYSAWFPHLHGHMIGYDATIVNELQHFLRSVSTDSRIEPHGASFEDGYRCSRVCDAILKSARLGRPCEVETVTP